MRVFLISIMAVVRLVSQPHQEPRPAPEMQRLAGFLLGNWSTSEKHEPGDIAPKGGLGRGSDKVRLGPGGMSLISNYESVDPSGKFLAHIVIWWDAKAQAYRGVECHNRSAAGCEIGLWRWEGNDLVSHEEGVREVFTTFTPTSHTFYMEASTDSGPMRRIMTISYTKTGGN